VTCRGFEATMWGSARFFEARRAVRAREDSGLAMGSRRVFRIAKSYQLSDKRPVFR
jgi:hypothetical protein